MDKINFQNGITPLNDTNLNQMQTNIEEAIEQKHIYSTEEQVVGTWIDGRPLYRKTLVINDLELSKLNDTLYETAIMSLSNIDYFNISRRYLEVATEPSSIYLSKITSDICEHNGSFMLIKGWFDTLLIQGNIWTFIKKGYITIEYTKITA